MKTWISAIIISVLLSGCVTRGKVIGYMEEHPQMMAKYCASEFPIKTEYIRGKSDTITSVVKDTITRVVMDCPPDKDGNVAVLKCPPNELIYKYIHNTDTLIRENFAMTEQWRLKSNEWETKYNKADLEREMYKEKANKRSWIIIGMGICLGVLLFAFIRR